MNNVISIAKSAKEASVQALQLSTEIKNIALNKIADFLSLNKEQIFTANNEDLKNAQLMLQNGEISQAVFNRLKLDENKLRDMIQGVHSYRNIFIPNNFVNRVR